MKVYLKIKQKIKISELAGKIDQLSNEFKKEDYPYETSEQRNKRLMMLKLKVVGVHLELL